MEAFSFRRFVLALVAFVVVLAAGTVGFVLLTDEGWSSSFYRSVVSTTLTGLDTPPESTAAELFTVALLLAGVAIFLYLAGAVVEIITRGVVREYYGAGRRRRAISQLRNHTIICGFGRVGRSVATEFDHAGRTYVVIDVNPASIAAAVEFGALVVQGDGTDDANLEIAGLEYASALVASADSDEKNLFITLSARAVRPDILIVARASDDSAKRKLVLAGADRVVQPYTSAGLRIANLVLKPQVVDYLDVVSTAGGEELRFEEITVVATCGVAGRPLSELAIPENTGAMIVALRRGVDAFVTAPAADSVLDVGDVLIGVGSADQIRRLEEIFAPGDTRSG
ncbi:MAG: potassium channel protein [Thermoleophilia bacterium]|nr:potassium channel protein [Thermoleophilia bacterium]